MIDPRTGLVDWHVDLYYDDQWNEITRDVLVTDTLRITRGRADYEGDIPPSQCSFVLDNTTGVYSPKNPYSPLYGKIGRNQPVRVRVGNPDVAAQFDGQSDSFLHTAGDGATELENDFFLVVDIEPDTWFPDHEQLIAESVRTDGEPGWMLILRPDGAIRFLYLRPDNSSAIFDLTYERYTGWGRRRAFEARFWYDDTDARQQVGLWSHDNLNADDGAIGDVWWGIDGDTVRPAYDGFAIGTTPGQGNLFGVDPFRGYVHGFRFGSYSGAHVDEIRMTVPSNPGDSFTDSTGYLWTVGSTATAVDKSTRFAGDVQAWPARWGQPDGADAHVPITAYSIRKRLGRTVEPLKSAFRRASLNYGPASRTLAYWPMEDGEGSRHFASEVGDYPLLFGNIPGYHVRDIDLATNSDFVASDPLPEFHITAATGRVARSASTGEYRLYALVRLPDDGVPEGADGPSTAVDVFTLHMTGTISEWTLQASSGGSLRVKRVRASDGAIGYTEWGNPPSVWQSPDYEGYNGRTLLLGLWIRQTGNDVTYQRYTGWTEDPRYSAVDYVRNETDLGYPIAVTAGTTGDLGGTVIGHVTLWNRDTNDSGSLWGSITPALAANTPETATERVTRILREEALPARIDHSPIEAELVGVQHTGSPFDVLKEAATADLAIFADQRITRALYYRPRGSLYNQDPVTLDYEQGHVVAPFEPTDDDEPIANDVTVQRRGGSSSRAVQETGPLSVADPPAGVGRYDESVTVNVADDVQLPNQAGWRLHMGTIDEVRYPTLTVSLNGSPELVDRLLPVDIGDRIQVRNLPVWVPPNMADLIVQGYTEESDGLQWTLTFNCTPASAWSVGVADDPVYGRADTAGSHLLYGVDETAQMLPVLTTDGPRWVQNTDADNQFPFDVTVGGEDITVTNIHPLLSDDFIRGDAGLWDDPVRGLWDNTFIWSA